MTRILYTFIRYLLTAAGASEAVLSSDAVMQTASGIVAAASVLWGLYESRRHSRLETGSGGDKTASNSAILPLLVAGFLLLPVLGSLSGCSTLSETSDEGDSDTVDWDAVNVLVKGSAQTATVLILANNDDLTDAFAALNAGVAAVFVGTPTQESLEAAIEAMDTGLEDADVTLVAGVLMTACDYYTAKSGQSELVASNTVVKGLVSAFTEGVSAGIALHKSDVSTSSED